jgi:probable rRNA maturation factor
MAKLHVEFSGVEGTTDVLSFDYRGIEAAAPPAVEAEVVVCVDVALRESRRRGLRFHDELELYWIHGLLHACGLDDHSVRDRRAMRRAERSVFVSLGGVPRRRPLR